MLSNVSFCRDGRGEGSLISEMSEEFVWSSIFVVFKLSRVNNVNEFSKLSPQL